MQINVLNLLYIPILCMIYSYLASWFAWKETINRGGGGGGQPLNSEKYFKFLFY